jgi:DNA polymerase
VTRVVSLDFELASIPDLTDVGADVWTKHADTVPILVGFALDHDEPHAIGVDLLGLHPSQVTGNTKEERDAADAITCAHALRDTLLDAVSDDSVEIHAWNANFEFNVWNNIFAAHLGWPHLPIERFHCTMASAACAGLPMSLNEAALALNSPYLKSKGGHLLMMRMARPRRIECDGTIHWWHREDPAKNRELIKYNVGDVRAEREVHLRIPRMTKREREIWLVDQHMNMRGLPVDGKLLDAMHQITFDELILLNQRICTLTGGHVSGSTQNLKLLAWAQGNGYPAKTLERDTLDAFIRSTDYSSLQPHVQEVLRLRFEASKTSTSKLRSIAHYAQLDGWARNLIQYGGAVRTLRWAGRGPQVQNFPRPIVKHVPEAIEAIRDGMDANGLRLLFGNPLDVVSSCLRGVFAALPGHSFAICDYHAIEAIVLAWLAEFPALLDVFRRGDDVYMFTAKGVGSGNRQLGKVLRLACGYAMGHVKFRETAAAPPYNLPLTLTEARAAVVAFRAANAPIVSLWHGCEASARNAILRPGDLFTFRKLRFRMASPNGRLAGSLLMELPSGRNLVYRNVRLENGRIVFWGVDQMTRRWKELDTYGGKLVENATQAVARDLLAEAVVRLEQDYPGAALTTVHDEIIAMERDDRVKTLFYVMQGIMRTPPSWGSGLPLSCSGAITKRYGKI